MTKIYVATYADSDSSYEGFSEVLGTYKTKEEALNTINADIKRWKEWNPHKSLAANLYNDCILYGDSDNGCRWQVLEVEVPNE